MTTEDTQREELIQQLVRDSRKADREDKELGEAMSRLVKNPDFQSYMAKVIYPRVQAFGDELAMPSGSADGLVRSEYLKGALCGLCLARDMPSVIIAAMGEVRAAQETFDANS